MEAFTQLDGLVVPLDRANVDTDVIIPKQFLKSIKRTGFGPNLFDAWRYRDHGEPGQDNSARPLREEFILNQPRYQGANILLVRENFGCGSSREHAVWAMQDYGFRCVIGPSFAEIFSSNCGKNGVLAIRLDANTMDKLFDEVEANTGYRLHVDLEHQQISRVNGELIPFDFDPALKQLLLNGIDEISVTLQHSDEIRAYEQQRLQKTPWLFTDLA